MATLLDELLLKIFGFLGCSVVRWVGRSVGEPFGESGFVLPSHFESASVQRNLAVVEPATKISLNYIGRLNYNRFLGFQV